MLGNHISGFFGCYGTTSLMDCSVIRKCFPHEVQSVYSAGAWMCQEKLCYKCETQLGKVNTFGLFGIQNSQVISFKSFFCNQGRPNKVTKWLCMWNHKIPTLVFTNNLLLPIALLKPHEKTSDLQIWETQSLFLPCINQCLMSNTPCQAKE